MARISPKVQLNGFVAKLVKDPKNPPKVRLIRGYIGESDKKGCARVYLDAELRRFVDVPEDGIVHAETLPEAVSSLGAAHVWVREDARITHRGSWAASEDPTTMATGEEGGGDPTTMATGEEALGIENPLDLVVNPFGRF
jgi:hypothetical protein